MKRILLVSFITTCNLLFMNAQVFMTELADPQDKYNARYVEIFNAGEEAVDLAAMGYGLLRYTNANEEPQKTIYPLTGTIAPKGFYLVAKDADVFEGAFGIAPDQVISNTSGPTDANGDDKILLVMVGEDTTTVDMYGVIGELGADYCHGYLDGRAERAANVSAANEGSWNSDNWNVWGSTTPTIECGMHTTQIVTTTDGIFDPGSWIGYTPSNTIVSFETLSSEVSEGGVSIDVCVTIENASASEATSVDVMVTENGSAANDVDFENINSPITLTFAAGSSDKQCVTIQLIDDTEKELTETILLELTNAQGGSNAEIGTQPSHIVEITDNDIVSPGVGAIIITEITQNPKAVSDANGEWFEIFNTTDADIDLFGIKFKDDQGADEFFVIDQSIILKANEYFVLAKNIDSETNGGVVADYQYPDNITLANGTDGILIECAGELIDAVIYDDGATFPDPNGASMYLLYDKYNATDNDNGANWATSDSSFGDGDFGTPGYSNFPTSTAQNMDLEMTIYPNPVTHGVLNLQFADNEVRTFELYNAVGALVFHKVVSAAQEQITLDRKSGFYLLKISENNTVTTQRIIVK